MKALMGAFALLAFLCTSFAAPAARADFARCSRYVADDPRMSRAVEFLRSIAGQYDFGPCSIELHVCSEYADDDQPGSLVGDLMVTNREGRQTYVQLDFPRAGNSDATVVILNGRIMFHYEFDDRRPDPVFGNRESIRLEFVKSQDQRYVVRLEEGWYSSSDWRERGRKGSVYRWSICDGAQSVNASAPAPTLP